MNNIIQLAEEAINDLFAKSPALKATESFQRFYTIYQSATQAGTKLAELKAALLSDTSFGDLRQGWIQAENSGGIIQDHRLLQVLVESVIEGQSVADFVASAREFASTKSSSLEFFVPLAGVRVIEPITLQSDAELIPWALVPECSQKQAFNRDFQRTGNTMIMPLFHFVVADSNSAIRIRQPERRILFPSSEGLVEEMASFTKVFLDRTVFIQDVLRCITAACSKPIAVLGSWMCFSNPLANRFFWFCVFI